MMNIGNCLIQNINTILLAATLGVLIVYTIFTYGLKKEAVKQTELSLRPFIVIDIFADRFFYKNIGHGPALDVKTDSFDAKSFILTFEKWDLIDPLEKRILNPKSEAKPVSLAGIDRPVKAHPPEFTPKALHERNSNLELFLHIHYKNLEKVRYWTKVKVSRKGIEFLDTDKI